MAGVPRISRWFLSALLVPIAMAAGPFTAPAGAQSATGSIEGVVVDPSGAVLPGVAITLTQTATGAVRTMTTDAQGLFRAPLLAVGAYELAAELSGFEPRRQADIGLTVGQTLTFRVELRLAGIAEAVTVSAATPVLETSRSQVSSTVDEAAVQNLPVNGRNFIDFALLTPGVTKDVRTGDISFAGQRGTLNSLIVDGADSNNTFFGQAVGRTGSGRAPYQFSQDAVKEFQVNSNSFTAEYGRAGGAVINVVTKSGTNDVSGSVFEFYRDKALNANNAINELQVPPRPKSPYHYHQFGGTLGGPIQRNKHFFFFNYDGQRNLTPNLVFLNLPPNTPNDPATQAAIAALTPKAESWNRQLDQNVFLVKTDHELNADNRLSLRYNHQNFTGEGYENGGNQNSFEHTGASIVRTRTVNASWTGILGSTLFNELRFQYARDQEPGEANSESPEALISEGATTVLVIGRNNFSPRETTIDRWQVADTVTWVRAAHKLKAGFDFQFDDIYNVFPGFFSGSYTFRTLASFAGGRPTGAQERYQQNFAGAGTTGPESQPNIREYSFFVQDEWKVSTDIAINAGLRYDLMKTNAPPVKNPDAQLAAADIDTSRLDADRNNWGPRLGVAWAPEGRKYIVRGGWGLFYGRTPSIMLGTAHTNNGLNVSSLTFTGDQVPTYPNKFSSIPGGGTAATPNIFYIDKDFANPRLMQANVAFERQLSQETALAVTYLFVDGTSLPRSIDRNVGTLGSQTYTVAGTGETFAYHRFGTARPFTNFTRVIAFESTAESRYNGVSVELNRRVADNLSVRAAYTMGKVEDTVPDATAVVPGSAGDDAKYASNPADFESNRTVGNNDQRHRFVLSGIYNTNGLGEGLEGFARALVKGWNLSAIFTAQSGQPYTARVGAADLNNDGNNRNDIAPGTTRNQFWLGNIVTLDPRISRDIPIAKARLQLIFEAFNLLNSDNISGVNTAYYNVAGTVLTKNAAFGTPTTSAGERIIQLAVKIIF